MSDSTTDTGARADLFRHVSAEKAALYRAVLEVFAGAKRQFRLHLRPDEVADELAAPPPPEALQAALTQLVDWGNLQAQPDTGRVSSIEDFYRARFLYRMSQGGEAVESALAVFEQALGQRGELQSVALEDILARLYTLRTLAAQRPLDAAKVHETLRDLVHVFDGLADNAQAFMAGVARSVELQRADVQAVLAYKTRLIDYLERFIGELVSRSGPIAECLLGLAPGVDALLAAAAEREARDAAPGDEAAGHAALVIRLAAWRERWNGLGHWFVSTGQRSSQAEQLRARARAAIPQLLGAVAALNERRAGRSDRSADFRVLARWFAEARDDTEAHRLWRAAFALSPARHLAQRVPGDEEVAASTPWREAPAIPIEPRLRERARITPRGVPPKVRDRSRERELLALRLADERAREQAARRRLATGQPVRLSAIGALDRHEFRLLLSLIGEALSAQIRPDATVERPSADGALRIRLQPLGEHTRAVMDTELGRFSGRDHLLTVTHGTESA